MTEDQIQRCKQSLLKLDQEQKLEQKLEQKIEAKRALLKSDDTETLNQSRVGRLSRMEIVEGHHTALEATSRREMRAEDIEGGLRRIESGQYGNCFYCEEEIDYSILEADPTNTRCSKC